MQGVKIFKPYCQLLNFRNIIKKGEVIYLVSYNVSKMDKTVEEQRKALREAEKKREEQLNAIYAIIGEKIVNDLNVDCTSFTSKSEIIEAAETILASVDNDLLSEVNSNQSGNDNNKESVHMSNQ